MDLRINGTKCLPLIDEGSAFYSCHGPVQTEHKLFDYIVVIYILSQDPLETHATSETWHNFIPVFIRS